MDYKKKKKTRSTRVTVCLHPNNNLVVARAQKKYRLTRQTGHVPSYNLK